MNKYQSSDSSSYSLGMSLTIEALKHVPDKVKEVYLSAKCVKNEQLSFLLELCKQNNISVVEDESVFDKLSLKENCYCIGVFEKFNHSLSTNKHVVLYQFDDPGELGTIMRSAVSFDYEDIVLIDTHIDYFDPVVVRASMGAIFHLNIVSYDTIEDYLNDYDDFFMYPFVPHGGHELNTLTLYEPYCLIIPQKYHGLDKLFKEGYYIEHLFNDEISLSSLSSIVFSFCYHQTLNGKNSFGKVLK